MKNEKSLAGKRIKLVRKVLALTQEGFADALNTDARTLRRWESGEVSAYGLERVAAKVNLPPWYFYLPEPESDFKQRIFAALKAQGKPPQPASALLPAGFDVGGLRQVNKIIYLVKAISQEGGTPLLLSYFSPDWRGMNLLPNANAPELATKDTAYAEHMLALRFDLSILDVAVDFNRDDHQMRSAKIKQTQDETKAKKYGEYAQYNFFYAVVKILHPPVWLLEKHFMRCDRSYQWVSMDYMDAYPEIKEHNADVLDFLQKRYGNDLAGLPLAFEETIRG